MRVNLGFALLLGASASAAEPPVRAQPAKPTRGCNAATRAAKLQAGDVRILMYRMVRESIGRRTRTRPPSSQAIGPARRYPVATAAGRLAAYYVLPPSHPRLRSALPDPNGVPDGPPDARRRVIRWGPNEWGTFTVSGKR
jgi:hypothetical protein